MAGNPDNGTWNYTYDGANRMITARDPATMTTTYGYDGSGNRTSVKVGAAPAVTTTYDSAGLPLSSSDGTTFTYDPAGNMTAVDRPGTATDWTYTYDPWSRMTRAAGSAATIDYDYDALDRMISKDRNGTVTAYAYSGDSEDPVKTVQGGTTTLYAWSPSGPLAQKQGSATRFFLTDLHEDVVGLADAAGALSGTASYSPWGERRTTTGESAYLGFQSDPTDPDTGLVDMMTRFYDPALGRFTSRDVLFGDPFRPTSLNQYVYAEDAPVTYTDPTGMVIPIGGGGSGGGGGGSSGGDEDEDYHLTAGSSYTGNQMSSSSPSINQPAPKGKDKLKPWQIRAKKRQELRAKKRKWAKQRARRARARALARVRGSDFVLTGRGQGSSHIRYLSGMNTLELEGSQARRSPKPAEKPEQQTVEDEEHGEEWYGI